jgi:hypothetical protein
MISAALFFAQETNETKFESPKAFCYLADGGGSSDWEGLLGISR